MAKIQVLRSDQGGEYQSKEFIKFCEEEGIEKHVTQVYTPHQNGIAECKNGILVESAWSMALACKAPPYLMTKVVSTATYFINKYAS